MQFKSEYYEEGAENLLQQPLVERQPGLPANAAPNPVAQPRPPRISVRRIAEGLAYSSVVAIIFNFGRIKDAVLWACSMAVLIFGDPAKNEKDILSRWEKKVDSTIEKGVDKIPAVVPIIPLKTPEQIEAERRRKLDKLRAEAEAIGMTYEESWTQEKLEVQLHKFKDDQAEAKKERERKAKEAEKRAKEAERQAAEKQAKDEERKALLDRATRILYTISPNIPLHEMEKDIKRAEAYDAARARYDDELGRWEQSVHEYKARMRSGPNASCPSCGTPCRVATSNTSRSAMCVACKFVTARSVMLGRWRNPPPPEKPREPDEPSGLLGTFFGWGNSFQ